MLGTTKQRELVNNLFALEEIYAELKVGMSIISFCIGLIIISDSNLITRAWHWNISAEIKNNTKCAIREGTKLENENIPPVVVK